MSERGEERDPTLRRRLGRSRDEMRSALADRLALLREPAAHEPEPLQPPQPPQSPPVERLLGRLRRALPAGWFQAWMRRCSAGPGLGMAFVIYLLLALAATWPLPLKCKTHCWGGRFDLWGNLWLMHYFFTQLSHGTLSTTTPLLFYPEGFSLWGYGHFMLQLLICPLLAVLSPPTAYAVLLWLSLALSALALYHLAREQTDNRWAALVGGALYTFHSIKYAEMSVGSIEQVATFGLPLFVHALWQWWRKGTWRWWLLVQALIIGTAMCNWFYGIALTAYTVLFTAFHLVRRVPQDGERGVAGGKRLGVDTGLLRKSVLLGLGSLILVSPALLAVRPEILQRPSLNELDVAAWKAPDEWQKSRDKMSAVFANVKEINDQDDIEGVSATLSQITEQRIRQTALRQTVDDALALDRVLAEDLVGEPRAAGPGFQLVLLGLVGLVLGGRRARFWAFTWLSLTVVSLGPYLRTGEDAAPYTSVHLPYYYLYELLPVMRVAYRPYRFQAMAVVALAVLAALGVAELLRRIRRPGVRATVGVTFLVLTLFVRWVLCSPNRAVILADASIPRYYEALAADRTPYGLVEIPYHHWSYGDSNSRFQYYQTLHGKPILNNPEFINMQQLLKLRRLVDQHPLLLALSEQQHTRYTPIVARFWEDVQWMRSIGFRYLVVHTTFPRDLLHLSGFQEGREVVSEGYLDLLEALFGAPQPVPGGLIFDVRKTGRGVLSGPGSALVSGLTFDRRHHSVRLDFQNPLRWNVKARSWKRLAFWAIADPGSERMRVRIEVKDGGRLRIVQLSVYLDEHTWRRIAFSQDQLGLSPDAQLLGVELTTASHRPADVSILGVELL